MTDHQHGENLETITYDPISVPFRYVDSLEQRQHIALFYDDPEYARLIEFRFIKDGLLNGEQCVYATEEDSGTIVLKFLTYGIPLKYFQTKKLRVIQIHETNDNREQIFKQCKKDIEKILDGLISPFRIVSRIVPNVKTLDGISVELEFEKEAQHDFDEFGGSLLCPYDLSKIETTKRKEWLKQLRETHHAVVYAPKFGQGGVFYPC